MSWSSNAVGRAPAVAKKVAEDIARIKCSEPEETVKNKVGEAIAAALGGMDPNAVVKVDANGSQSTYGGTAVNSLSVSIVPQYGFVE